MLLVLLLLLFVLPHSVIISWYCSIVNVDNDNTYNVMSDFQTIFCQTISYVRKKGG